MTHLFRLWIAIIVLACIEGAWAQNADPLVSSAEAGDVNARHDLCYQYLYGERREKNLGLAFRWCTAAAESGAPSSQTLLAEMYLLGLHVAQDVDKAKALYLLAAKQGHHHAQLIVGQMAPSAKPPDIYHFCFWTKAAAEQKYDVAIDRLRQLDEKWRKEQGPSGPGYCDTVLTLMRPNTSK